jgi:hypothetical protein
MYIHTPLIITPRLLPGAMIGGAFISIEYSERPGQQGRQRYRYYIDIGNKTHTDDDLQSGVGGGSLQRGLASLLSFLSAAAESYQHRQDQQLGENADLFPRWMAPWLVQNDDEISSLQIELEEGGPFIKE